MELIDKAAVVAEIKKRIAEGEKVAKELPSSAIMGLIQAYKNTLSFLDTLEVKEVDLEKEIDDYINKHFSECDDGVLISDANSTELTLLDAASIARYFFELGLKAKGK